MMPRSSFLASKGDETQSSKKVDELTDDRKVEEEKDGENDEK